jgi:GNAT superfamily N-acetyltransferase
MERKIYIPESVPEKHKRISDIVLKKYGLRIRKFKSKAEVKKSGVVHDIFRLINESYTPLFGFSRLSERQIDYYVKAYVPVLDLRMVTLVETEEGEIVAVGISMPSLSEALQKAKGKFFPFGWYHLLKALKWNRPKVLDLLLVAVRPDYQSKGVNALLFTDLIPVYQEMGFEYAESNPHIEFNGKLFVFSGFGHASEKEHPIVKKVIEKGGQYRSKVSGLTNYLVVDPSDAGSSPYQTPPGIAP